MCPIRCWSGMPSNRALRIHLPPPATGTMPRSAAELVVGLVLIPVERQGAEIHAQRHGRRSAVGGRRSAEWSRILLAIFILAAGGPVKCLSGLRVWHHASHQAVNETDIGVPGHRRRGGVPLRCERRPDLGRHADLHL